MQVYYWQNDGNPTPAALEEALQQVFYLQGRVATLESENEALQKQLIELQRQLETMQSSNQAVGAAIPFRVVPIVFGFGTHEPEQGLSAIIHSIDELNALRAKPGNEWLNTDLQNGWAAFDEAFFADKALILHFEVRPSVSVLYSLESVSFNNGEVALQIVGQFSGNQFRMAITNIRLVIEVNQSDISNTATFTRNIRHEELDA